MRYLLLPLLLLAAPIALATDGGGLLSDAGVIHHVVPHVIIGANAMKDGGTAIAVLHQQADGGVSATIPDPTQDFSAFAQMIYVAVQESNWKLLAIMAIIGLVYLLKTYGGKKIQWLDTDRGGAFLALLVGIAGALGNALAAARTITPNLLISGVIMGVTAAGGYSIFKKILWPQDMPGSDATPTPPPATTASTDTPAKPVA